MVTEPTNLSLDAEAKKKAYAVFEQVGIQPAQAVNMFLHQVALQGELPFGMKLPNVETTEAMQEIADGKGKRYQSSQDLYDDLGI